MTTYPLGALVDIDTAVTDDNGNPIDATMALTVVQPDLTTVSPDVSHVGSAGSGTYTAQVVADQAGTYTWLYVASGSVTMSDAGQFDTADPAPPSYASVAELRIRLGIQSTSFDSILADKLATASREIEDDCGGRKFWLDPQPTQRIFNPRHRTLWTAQGEKILIDDIGSLAGLIVEVGTDVVENGWSAVPFYEVGPDNALAKREPITSLLRPFNSWAFTETDRVRVTAQWGWPYIPWQIHEACLIYAMRLYRRKDSPEGTTGSAEMGQIRISNYDPDYVKLIDGFMDRGGG